MKQLLFLFILGAFVKQTSAQNITGTWQGNMLNEFVQINIEQKGNQLCGYTYDYILNDKKSRCIATFEGLYDPERKLWYIYGRRFIENSGGHVLMKLVFWNEAADGKNVLKGRVFTSSLMGAMLEDGNPVEVKRVSSKPQQLGNLIPPCFPTPAKSATKKPTPVAAKPTVPAKPSTVVVVKPTVPNKPPAPVVVKPTAPKSTPVPQKTAGVTKPTIATEPTKPMKPTAVTPNMSISEQLLVKRMNARKQQTQSKLQISVNRINLKVYDNGTIDNDTVSIFYNGRLLVNKQLLSETAIELNIDLDPDKTFHEFTMFAENLGSIPPNTALIVITADDKRYELRSKASLEENAVLIVEYKPK